MDIKNKVALVTGGASGIGRACAEHLKREGANVVIADVDVALGERTAADLGAGFLELDVRDPAAWEGAIARVVADHGAIDIGLLNAGLLTPVGGERGGFAREFDITRLEDADYRRVTSVNIDGVVFGARAISRAMLGRGGALVATSSVVGLIPFPPDPIYSLTKHAMVGFVRSTAPTLARHHITFNVICPGTVETDITSEDYFEQMAAAGVGVMDPSAIADAVARAIASGGSGETLVCIPDRAPFKLSLPTLDP